MKVLGKLAGVAALAWIGGGFGAPAARAQAPIVVAPIVVETAAPIIVGAVKPKSKNAGLGKFEGYVMNANIAQITLRAKDNETWLQTFTLSRAMSEKMQTIVDKGGYQYGDKVTIYYDPTTKQALKIKGKPSKPI
jgi:hypothetical protein